MKTNNLKKTAFFAAIAPKTVASGIDGFSIKELSVAEIDIIRKEMTAAGSPESFGLRLVAMSVIDVNGEPVLTMDDIPALQQSSNDLVEKLTGKAVELNGFIKAAAAKN